MLKNCNSPNVHTKGMAADTLKLFSVDKKFFVVHYYKLQVVFSMLHIYKVFHYGSNALNNCLPRNLCAHSLWWKFRSVASPSMVKISQFWSIVTTYFWADISVYSECRRATLIYLMFKSVSISSCKRAMLTNHITSQIQVHAYMYVFLWLEDFLHDVTCLVLICTSIS